MTVHTIIIDPALSLQTPRVSSLSLQTRRVSSLQLDLSSTYSIRSFVKEFMRSRRRLDVLVNNAAMALNCRDLTRRKTKDGIEVTMATNYFGERAVPESSARAVL